MHVLSYSHWSLHVSVIKPNYKATTTFNVRSRIVRLCTSDFAPGNLEHDLN